MTKILKSKRIYVDAANTKGIFNAEIKTPTFVQFQGMPKELENREDLYKLIEFLKEVLIEMEKFDNA